MILEYITTLEEVGHDREHSCLMRRRPVHTTGESLQLGEYLVRRQVFRLQCLIPLAEPLGNLLAKARIGPVVEKLLDQRLTTAALAQQLGGISREVVRVQLRRLRRRQGRIVVWG